jgi:hypothetical protein
MKTSTKERQMKADNSDTLAAAAYRQPAGERVIAEGLRGIGF